MRSFARACGLLALAVLLVLASASLVAPARTARIGGSSWSSYQVTAVLFPSSSSVIDGPSLGAAFVDRVLSKYHSPAVGLGTALYADSQAFQIDDAYALAVRRFGAC